MASSYGENVTVGVLSDSYNNLGLAGADASNDDLPGNATNPNAVNVLQDYPTRYLAAEDPMKDVRCLNSTRCSS